MSTDNWQVILGLAAVFLNIVGLTFVGIQVTLTRNEARKAQETQVQERWRLKRHATVRFASETFQHLKELQASLPDDFDAAACAVFQEEILSGQDPEGMRRLSNYLGYLETFAMGISSGVFDLETADALCGSRLLAVSESYRKFIIARRSVNNHASIYREIEWLAEELKKFYTESGRYTIEGYYVPLALRTNRDDEVRRQSIGTASSDESDRALPGELHR